MEEGGFEYDSDYYGDDLPFWTEVSLPAGQSKGHLVGPYALDTNNMRFAMAQGFNTGSHFFEYLRDAFDVLYAEGADKPKMMSIGLHCRLIGRPRRFIALQRFLDHIEKHDRVWVTRRIDIARHWADHHPPRAEYSAMTKKSLGASAHYFPQGGHPPKTQFTSARGSDSICRNPRDKTWAICA